MKAIRAVVHGAAGMLLAMSAAAQAPIATDEPDSVADVATEPTMMRVVPYADEVRTLLRDEPASCYRIGRCSAYDLYRFRDRPNRLARLAPEAPPAGGASLPAIHYMWVLVPVTLEENILPKYRTASQVRDEYRGVGTPIDAPN